MVSSSALELLNALVVHTSAVRIDDEKRRCINPAISANSTDDSRMSIYLSLTENGCSNPVGLREGHGMRWA
jgi:hypothetical protein